MGRQRFDLSQLLLQRLREAGRLRLLPFRGRREERRGHEQTALVPPVVKNPSRLLLRQARRLLGRQVKVLGQLG